MSYRELMQSRINRNDPSFQLVSLGGSGVRAGSKNDQGK